MGAAAVRLRAAVRIQAHARRRATQGPFGLRLELAREMLLEQQRSREGPEAAAGRAKVGAAWRPKAGAGSSADAAAAAAAGATPKSGKTRPPVPPPASTSRAAHRSSAVASGGSAKLRAAATEPDPADRKQLTKQLQMQATSKGQPHAAASSKARTSAASGTETHDPPKDEEGALSSVAALEARERGRKVAAAATIQARARGRASRALVASRVGMEMEEEEEWAEQAEEAPKPTLSAKSPQPPAFPRMGGRSTAAPLSPRQPGTHVSGPLPAQRERAARAEEAKDRAARAEGAGVQVKPETTSSLPSERAPPQLPPHSLAEQPQPHGAQSAGGRINDSAARPTPAPSDRPPASPGQPSPSVSPRQSSPCDALTQLSARQTRRREAAAVRIQASSRGRAARQTAAERNAIELQQPSSAKMAPTSNSNGAVDPIARGSARRDGRRSGSAAGSEGGQLSRSPSGASAFAAAEDCSDAFSISSSDFAPRVDCDAALPPGGAAAPPISPAAAISTAPARGASARRGAAKDGGAGADPLAGVGRDPSPAPVGQPAGDASAPMTRAEGVAGAPATPASRAEVHGSPVEVDADQSTPVAGLPPLAGQRASTRAVARRLHKEGGGGDY
jgi:hypothetical protein